MTAKNEKKAPINAIGDADGKSKYWGIIQNGEPLFEGTYEQTWNELGKRYPNATMTTFAEQGIKIGRIK